VDKEIKRANIPVVDTGDNPEVPFPRDMIDLEVSAVSHPASPPMHPCTHAPMHPCPEYPTAIPTTSTFNCARLNSHRPKLKFYNLFIFIHNIISTV